MLPAFLPTVVEAQVWRLTGTSFRTGGHALFVIDPMQRIHRGVQACMHRDGLVFDFGAQPYGCAADEAARSSCQLNSALSGLHIVKRDDAPAFCLLLRNHHVVNMLGSEWRARSVGHMRVDEKLDVIRTERADAGLLDLCLDAGALVDRVEDLLVGAANSVTALDTIEADGGEIGIRGESVGEGGAVATIPAVDVGVDQGLHGSCEDRCD